MLIGEIQALNTLGVEALEKEDLYGSAQAFAEAVQKLPWCSLSPTPLGDMMSRREDDMEGMTVYFNNDPVAGVDYWTAPFLFESAESAVELELGLSPKEYASAAMSCLFNMGLVHHLQWDKCKDSAYLLQRALSFYEQAFSLTATIKVSAVDGSVLKVLMAVCNNASHCQREMSNLHSTKLWNDRCRRCLQVYGSGGRRGSSISVYFMRRTFFNDFPRVTALAA